MHARFPVAAIVAASLSSAFAISGARPAESRRLAAPSPAPTRVNPGSSVRVGNLLYRVERIATTRALELDDEERERAPAGMLYVLARLTRSNATQTFAPVNESGLRLRTRNGDRYSPSRVSRIWCHGAAECAVLDPGESRDDVLVWRVPESGMSAASLEIEAPGLEPGPRSAIVDVPPASPE